LTRKAGKEPSGSTESAEIAETDVNWAEQADVVSHAKEGDERVEESGNANGVSMTINGTELEFDPDQFSPSDFDSDSEAGSDDDGPLLTQAVSFNKLLLVLRDPGVMRFVKYLSAAAKGSRWDVGGEWEVGVMEEDEEGGEVQAVEA
jgi:hypothetical protein